MSEKQKIDVMSVTAAPETTSNDLLKVMVEMAHKISIESEDLNAQFAKVLNDNLLDLL